jgi:hypothetical protein
METVMVGAWWAWPLAIGVYFAFRLWYDSLKGPLRMDEIDSFLETFQRNTAQLGSAEGLTDPQVIRAFLEADDGREFFMSNLVQIQSGTPAHPITGTPTKGMDLLQEYFHQFVKLLFRYGGHPNQAFRKIGGYIDSWNTPADPGWHISSTVRYRSRRDLMRMVTDPTLQLVHPFKTAGTASTFSFPTQVVASFVLGPRVYVAIILALLAALIHLLSLILIITS